jgi:hypothetical protein
MGTFLLPGLPLEDRNIPMKPIMRWLVMTALFAANCRAAETFAYRFAGEPRFGPPGDSPAMTATSVSPFVAAGDKVFDLTAAVRHETKLALVDGWVLWNQTKHLLVVHGVPLDQWRIAEQMGFDEQPRNIRLTVDWIPGEPSDTPTAPPFATVRVLAAPGKTSNASAAITDPAGTAKFTVEIRPNVFESRLLDVGFYTTWTLPGSEGRQHGTVDQSVILLDGGLLPLASWQVTGLGATWHTRAKGELLLTDDTAWREARLRQEGDVARVVPNFSGQPPPEQWPQLAGWTVTVKQVSISMIRTLATHQSEDEPPEQVLSVVAWWQNWLGMMANAEIPERFKDLATAPMLDLRPMLAKAGITIEPDDFAAYDPLGQRVVAASRKTHIGEMIEQLFSVLDGDCSDSNLLGEAWLADAADPETPLAKIAVTTRNGCRVKVKCAGRKNRPLVSLTIDFSEDDSYFVTHPDFKSRFEHQGAPIHWQTNSPVHLALGIPLLTDGIQTAAGRTLRQGLKVSEIRSRREPPP